MRKTLKFLRMRTYSLFTSVIRHPIENIETMLSIVMVFIGLAIVLPYGGTVYGSAIGRAIFACLLWYPSLPLLYWRIRYSISEYVLKFQRRNKLFFLSIAYTYYMVLSIIVQGSWPPHWILYFGLACITWITYFRLGK